MNRSIKIMVLAVLMVLCLTCCGNEKMPDIDKSTVKDLDEIGLFNLTDSDQGNYYYATFQFSNKTSKDKQYNFDYPNDAEIEKYRNQEDWQAYADARVYIKDKSGNEVLSSLESLRYDEEKPFVRMLVRYDKYTYWYINDPPSMSYEFTAYEVEIVDAPGYATKFVSGKKDSNGNYVYRIGDTITLVQDKTKPFEIVFTGVDYGYHNMDGEYFKVYFTVSNTGDSDISIGCNDFEFYGDDYLVGDLPSYAAYDTDLFFLSKTVSAGRKVQGVILTTAMPENYEHFQLQIGNTVVDLSASILGD